MCAGVHCPAIQLGTTGVVNRDLKTWTWTEIVPDDMARRGGLHPGLLGFGVSWLTWSCVNTTSCGNDLGVDSIGRLQEVDRQLRTCLPDAAMMCTGVYACRIPTILQVPRPATAPPKGSMSLRRTSVQLCCGSKHPPRPRGRDPGRRRRRGTKTTEHRGKFGIGGTNIAMSPAL